MHFTFHLRQPFTKAMALAAAVAEGAWRHGDVVDIEQGFTELRDGGLVLFGIGGMAREIYDAYTDASRNVVFFDKGYTRGGWLRVSVNSFQPLNYFQNVKHPADRWERLGIELKPYGHRGDYILFDGASNKYCLWNHLPPWLDWGQLMIDSIEFHTDRRIIYRPRPSHNGAHALAGAELSIGPLADDLARAHVVVSHGGNIGFDCVVAGVPHFAIDGSIARPVSETQWPLLDLPYIPDEDERLQWCYDVAYCQWTLDEIASGEAWGHIRPQLFPTAD